MRSWFTVVTAASALAALAAPGARGTELNAAITSLPASAQQGGSVHVTALAVGGFTCSLTVRYADGRTQRLRSKPIVVFGVQWTWRVPVGAAPGTAQAALACGTAGQARQSFLVRRRLVPARVVVAKSGLTQVPHVADTGTDVAYGVVLVDDSPTSDATGVHVVIDLLDRSGRVAATDTRDIAAIPASGTYYLGGEVETQGPLAVVSLRPTVRIDGGRPPSSGAPVVSNVRVTPHGDDGGAYVDGQIANRGTATLSPLALVSTVLFDGAGRVVGGGVTFAASALPPGGSAPFELSTPVPASSIATALVSVDPQYDS